MIGVNGSQGRSDEPRESAQAILVGIGALLGCLLSTGVIAIILRLTSGKW